MGIAPDKSLAVVIGSMAIMLFGLGLLAGSCVGQAQGRCIELCRPLPVMETSGSNRVCICSDFSAKKIERTPRE